MAINRGKQFEQIVRECFERIPGVSIDRLHDQTTRYKGSSANICDFIVYQYPHQYYLECKSVHGNTLPFTNISDTQWKGLLAKSSIKGVYAGILCWWIDKDVTRFIPIKLLQYMREVDEAKSYRYDFGGYVDFPAYEIKGSKKRIFWSYDMEDMLCNISYKH